MREEFQQFPVDIANLGGCQRAFVFVVVLFVFLFFVWVVVLWFCFVRLDSLHFENDRRATVQQLGQIGIERVDLRAQAEQAIAHLTAIIPQKLYH